MTIDEELEELKRRVAEMENDPSACIPHERVNEKVMARLNNAIIRQQQQHRIE